MGLRFFGPLSKDKFAERLIANLRQAGARRTFVYDPREFRLLGEGETSLVANLTNVYADYCAAKGKRRQLVVQHFLRSMMMDPDEMPDNFEGAKHDLRPCLRARFYYECVNLRQRAGEQQAATPFELVNEHLAVGLAYDLPSSMRFLNQDTLDDWGVSFYEAMEVAKENLGHVTFDFGRFDNGLFISRSDDGYTSTRLLFHEVFQRFELEGELLVAVPNRDTLLVTSTGSSAEAIGMLATLVEEGLGQSRPITGRVFRLTGDEWDTWLPEPGHPHFQQLRLMSIRSQAMDYAEQKDALEKLHAHTEDDTFVATFNAVKNAEGDAFTYATWSAGVPTLLPRAAKIVFVPGMKQVDEHVIVDWDRARAVVGDLMVPEDVYPERYRVEQFPTEEQLAAMAADSVS